MENTFWNIGTDDYFYITRDGNFMKLFKKSFALYVESGLREKMEADVGILENELGGSPVTEGFKANFCKIISENYLRKIHCFYSHSTHLIIFFTYSPPWGS